jgi:hypothetical protein
MTDFNEIQLLAEAPEDDVGPTVTHHQQLAAELTRELRDLIARIPYFESPRALTVDFVQGHATVPLPFIATTVAAVEASEEARALNKFDANAARDVLQFIDAFRPFLDLMDYATRSLRFTLNSVRAVQAADALQIYVLLKGLARDPKSAALLPHIEHLKRDLGRKRTRRS